MTTMADLEEGQRLLHQIDAVGNADDDDGVGTGVGPLEEIIDNAAFLGEQPVNFIDAENAEHKREGEECTEAPSCVTPS